MALALGTHGRYHGGIVSPLERLRPTATALLLSMRMIDIIVVSAQPILILLEYAAGVYVCGYVA